VTITIVGWLLLIGVIIRIVLPDVILKVSSTLYASSTTLLLVAVISLALGGLLSFKGYWSEA
jgi:membrane protein YdbS with pleckstrin-like domain